MRRLQSVRPEDVPLLIAALQPVTGGATPGRVRFDPKGTGHLDLPVGQVKEPSPAGSLADLGHDARPESSVLLGQGMRAGGLGGNTTYNRSVVKRGNRLLEAHTYEGGKTKYFARKNPAVLQLAAQAAAAAQTGGSVPQAQGLAPRDEELLKLLLGNPTLRR